MTERAGVLAYWKTFFTDLFLGTFLYLFLFTAAGTLLGLGSALTLDNVYLDSSGWNGWVQWLVLLLALIWFPALGVLHGLVSCTVFIAGKKLAEMLVGLHDLLDLLSKGVLASLPHLDKRTPRKQFEEKFETLGHQFLNDLKLKGGPVNWVKRLVFLGILKALKFFFLDDVLEEIRKKETEEVSRADIESAVRRVGVEMLLPITEYLLVLHGLNGVALALTFGLPFFLFWVF